jgi:hypothetical protein
VEIAFHVADNFQQQNGGHYGEANATEFSALLAGHNYSNPRLKWRVRQLSELPSEWESQLPGPSIWNVCQRFLLGASCGATDCQPDAILSHALRIVAFSRRVLPWAQHRLLSPSSPPLCSFHGNDLATGRPLPHFDLDVAVRYQDGKFELLRLQGQGDIFSLSQEEYSLLCLFDGEAPQDYAFWPADTPCNPELGSELVQEMVALVRHGELEARAFMDEQTLSAILRAAPVHH